MDETSLPALPGCWETDTGVATGGMIWGGFQLKACGIECPIHRQHNAGLWAAKGWASVSAATWGSVELRFGVIF